MKVKYRNGYPTKKSINDAIDSYKHRLSFNALDSYIYFHRIHWQSRHTQEHIDAFVNYLNEIGIMCVKARDYSFHSSMTGRIDILPKTPN